MKNYTRNDGSITGAAVVISEDNNIKNNNNNNNNKYYYYKHKTNKLKFALEGLTCSACVSTIEELMKSFRFTLSSSSSHDAHPLKNLQVKAKVQVQGKELSDSSPEEDHRHSHPHRDCVKIETEKDGISVVLLPNPQLEYTYSILVLHGYKYEHEHGNGHGHVNEVFGNFGNSTDIESSIKNSSSSSNNNIDQILEQIESSLVDEIINSIESVGFGAEFISQVTTVGIGGGGEDDDDEYNKVEANRNLHYGNGGGGDDYSNPIRNVYLSNIDQRNVERVMDILENVEHIHLVKRVEKSKNTNKSKGIHRHRRGYRNLSTKDKEGTGVGLSRTNPRTTPNTNTNTNTKGATSTVEISYDCDQIGIRTILSLIETTTSAIDGQSNNTNHIDHANYTTQVTDISSYQSMLAAAELRRKTEIQQYFHSFLFSACCAIPVFIISMILVHIPGRYTRQLLHSHIFWNITYEEFLTWTLTTPVQFYSGARFYRDAYYSIVRGRHLNMGFLIAAGTSAAYFYSVFVVLYNASRDARGHDRLMQAFETSALLIMFVLLGKYLECKVKSFTGSAISKLSQLTPEVANLVGSAKSSNSDCANDTGIRSVHIFEQEEEKDGLEIEVVGDGMNVENNEMPYHPISEQQIPLILLQKNDVLVIRPGEKVPTDGIVILGSTSVDESMLTGESIPAHKEKGDSVIGGTINIDGSVYIQVNAIGKDTALSKIIELIESAQSSKAPIQEYADWIASRFVPVVTVIALLTYILWAVLLNTSLLDGIKEDWPYRQEGLNDLTLPLLFSISCLVIACPCALGLATPTAVMVGSGVGAKHGILIKGGEALESANKISAVVFDKTGTLTYGAPVVRDVILLSDRCTNTFFKNKGEEKLPEPDDVTQINKNVLRTILTYAACAEYGSEHPLAKGILTEAESHDIGEGLSTSLIPTEDFVAEIGSGIKCVINGHDVVIGNRRSLESNSIAISDGTFEAMKYLETRGQTAIVVSIDGSTEAVVGLIDKAREECSVVIPTLLHRMGIKTYMLTGDNQRTAQVVASEIGIPPENIVSDVLPEGKVDFIKRLQGLGECVAMVGDGVNDSPAMAQADVGIAVGAGTDVAIETSGIVLMNSKLTDVLVAIDLSRKVFSRIKLNFVWALGYNTMAIPIAAGALYPVLQMALPPFMAAVAMIMSSLSVLTSSLLLNLYKYKVKHFDISSFPIHLEDSLKPSFSLHDSTFGTSIDIYGPSKAESICQAMKEGKPCACLPDSCNCRNCDFHISSTTDSAGCCTGGGTSEQKSWSSDPTLLYPGCAARWDKDCTCGENCKCAVSCGYSKKEKVA